MTLPWNSFDADAVEEESNDFEPIPDKTDCLLMVTNAQRKNYEGVDYHEVELTVQGGDYNSRRIWSKIDFTNEPDKAQKKLARIVKATGMVEEFKKPINSDAELDAKYQSLIGKTCNGKIGLWEWEGKKGNWFIGGTPQFEQAPTTTQPETQPAPTQASGPWAG